MLSAKYLFMFVKYEPHLRAHDSPVQCVCFRFA